jgi:ketosteroid isomerase-like protein
MSCRQKTLRCVASLILAIFFTLPAGAAQKAPDYNQLSAVTAETGQRYLQAYFAKDWNTLETLLADTASFADPTATQLFGAETKTGKTAIMAAFRTHYAPISFQFSQESSMFAIDHAIFVGQLSWTYQQAQQKLVVEKMPIVVVLQMADGRVVSHRDYADYRPYFAAEAASRLSEKPARN